MKAWRFKLKRSPIEIGEKLESELKSIGGFVFNMNHENNKSVTFKMRKRILYAWYMAFQNWTVVNGKLSNNNSGNATNVKISFKQHILIRIIIYTHIILGLGLVLGLLVATKNEPSTYILGGIIIALGIIIWIATNRKFKKDAEKYKGLITETLGL